MWIIIYIDTSLVWIWTFSLCWPFSIFFKTRFVLTSKLIKWFCWFSIAICGQQLCTLYSNLKRIGQKLRPWECPIEKVQNGRHDVIKFEFSKTEKNDTSKYLSDHLCKVSAKSTQPFEQERCHTHTHRHTLIHTPSVSIATYSVKMTEYKNMTLHHKMRNNRNFTKKMMWYLPNSSQKALLIDVWHRFLA